MYSSINDEMRNKIINKNSLELTLLNIEQLDYNSKEYFFRLLLSDYYKINYYKGLIDKNFDFLEDFNNSIDYLLDMCYKDEDFLIELINCSKKFNSLKRTQKMMILDTLSSCDQDKTLINISNSHILDKLTYMFNYDLNSFKEYYTDFKDSSLLDFIVNKLVSYKKENYEEYKKFILEFIKVYYKWTIFSKDNLGRDHLYKEDNLYLEIIRFNTIEDLINLSLSDIDFLKTIVENYLFYSTCEKQVSEEIIDKFYSENVDEEIRKKLR